ncbi:hypothetical protein B296_00015763 [Ensete ventricosum]|uniref:Diaminopimelate epimerase n=1 Tax=Ensete ventricosum TaxID=4639 RepID=A0A426ZN52_ENSVE|nr:hypothetical protein B296_00015763 [Ensete ventricosum]
MTLLCQRILIIQLFVCLQMCGNGIRCFARFITELENLHGMQSFRIHTGAGLIVPEIQSDGKVEVDMGHPILHAPDIPTKIPANKNGSVIKAELVVDGISWNVTCVSMGNPHCVTFEFVQVISRSHLKMRVWERGAGATLACGTGACAVVVAAVLEGHTERVENCMNSIKLIRIYICALFCAKQHCIVELPGGPLEIEWREEDNHVYMTGPAEVVFYGSVPL